MRQASGTLTLVRNAIKTSDRALRKSEIRDLIGLSGDNGYGRVNNAVRDLVKRGEAERVGYGRYQWTRKTPDVKDFKIQNQIWRFMWIRSKKNEPFTVRMIHELTGIAHYTIRSYATFLLRSGHLERVGKKKAFKTSAPLYLIARDKMNESFPVMRRHKESSDIERLIDSAREMAAGMFQTANTSLDTIQKLLQTTRTMIRILERCEKAVAARKRNPVPVGNQTQE
ncbi:MAG: hypothetical protein PHD57_13825 [Desulfobacterales bacterium]|jgi:hypothetical protein|nr:hypothetical protein [Desulfobacterales bacterium]MDD3082768.1 hypothetical protein [Desulfobacterales bacterium]MDD3951865.1 hypothetical protein [Desulfobacterales bacterium]